MEAIVPLVGFELTEIKKVPKAKHLKEIKS